MDGHHREVDAEALAARSIEIALRIGVFDALSGGSATAAEVAWATSIAVHDAEPLLATLVALGLLRVERGRYANATAAEASLVRGAAGDFRPHLDPALGRAFVRF